ncbi:WhiB family transcriptional regulator [Streptomyces sp. NBC_01003]|uniref:WhiB family transcriptional regulator n=1 Tax=Streptomyces sp. NBC_01003 TaxID=2903714 RepID=UPI00386F321C|nr:WhiB family transcriptional regulator [Streptomyces sp. NBC_01003]
MYWRERAACLRVDPDLFFPIGNSGPALTQIDEAKAVCGSCPVLEQCLGWAVGVGQVEGIWGGMTESERRAIRRRGARRGKEMITKAA